MNKLSKNPRAQNSGNRMFGNALAPTGGLTAGSGGG